jgi:hypothetical protein
LIVPRNVDDIIKKLSPAQRKKVEARAAELTVEETTLCELRHAPEIEEERSDFPPCIPRMTA